MTKEAQKTDDLSVMDEIKLILISGFSLCYLLAIDYTIYCLMQRDLCGACADNSFPDSMGPE